MLHSTKPDERKPRAYSCDNDPYLSKNVHKRPYEPFHANEPYPANCGVNFRLLPLRTLMAYANTYGVNVRPEATREQCATAVARHFANWKPDEETILCDFIETLSESSASRNGSFDQSSPRNTRRKESFEDASGDGGGSAGGAWNTNDTDELPEDEGGAEVVAVLAPSGDRKEEWILARVIERAADGQVTVQDEDDRTRQMTLPARKVKRLEGNVGADGTPLLAKGDNVLAVYPDTTAFYPAVIHRIRNGRRTVSVLFDDDVDETGRLISQNVSLRNILPNPNASKSSGGATANRGTPARVRSISPTMSSTQKSPPGKGEKGEDEQPTSAQKRAERAARAEAKAAREAAGGGMDEGGPAPGPPVVPRVHDGTGATYSNRIAHALLHSPDLRSNFRDLCAIIQRDFEYELNWKLESDLRKTPVWKSSVRKILYSNSRFVVSGPESARMFTFSRPNDELKAAELRGHSPVKSPTQTPASPPNVE